MGHKQKVRVERRVLDLESEVMRGLDERSRFYSQGARQHFSLDFFHIVKPPMPILALWPMLCVCEKPERWEYVLGKIWHIVFQVFADFTKGQESIGKGNMLVNILYYHSPMF